MKDLFEKTVINGVPIPNRFVRSATREGLATAKECFATKDLTRLLVKLAQGDVGLIITCHTYVSPEGQAAPCNWVSSRTNMCPA